MPPSDKALEEWLRNLPVTTTAVESVKDIPLGRVVNPEDIAAICARIQSVRQEAAEEAKEKAEAALHQLNWMQILRKAIDSRPTSWKQDPVWEWRNASDEVMFSVLRACYEAGIFIDPWKAAAEYVRNQQKADIGHGGK